MAETRKENVRVKKDKKNIEKKVQQLQNRVEINERILEEDNPRRQKMLFHELGKVSNELDAAVTQMITGMGDKELEAFKEYLLGIRKSSDKLSSIKKQILRINFETFSTLEDIELKSYLQSYLKYTNSKVKVKMDLTGNKVIKRINIYDFGVLIDNLILNAIERDATIIEIIFKENDTGFNFISNTGPIDIKPIDNIFKLGVTSKDDGTYMGLYMCKDICNDFGWDLSVTEFMNDLVNFSIDFR